MKNSVKKFLIGSLVGLAIIYGVLNADKITALFSWKNLLFLLQYGCEIIQLTCVNLVSFPLTFLCWLLFSFVGSGLTQRKGAHHASVIVRPFSLGTCEPYFSTFPDRQSYSNVKGYCLNTYTTSVGLRRGK